MKQIIIGFKTFGVICLLCVLLFPVNGLGQYNSASANKCNKVVVGYWHTWDHAAAKYIPLNKVDCIYNVINVSFLIPDPTASSKTTMMLSLEEKLVSKDEFKAQIKEVQGKGVRVMVSVGGATGHVELKTNAEKEEFVRSTIEIVKEFGFQGFDIDIEGGGLSLDNGDLDFKNPTTPKVVNLIDAVKQIKAELGDDFWITAAPEVTYVQGGLSAYGGVWGAYLPFIYGIKDIMEYIHVQYYNTGGVVAPDEQNYNQGSADFIVAMTDMLAHGFKVGGINSEVEFPALKEEQIAFGLPAVPSAAPSGGHVPMTEVEKALDYLTKGKSFGGKYVIRKEGGYPNLRGAMTWSVNWDKTGNDAFGKSMSKYFCGVTNLCDPDGIENQEHSLAEVRLFVDPNNQFVELIGIADSDLEVELITLTGKVVKKNFGKIDKVGIAGLKAGVYLLVINNNGQKKSFKFTKLN